MHNLYIPVVAILVAFAIIFGGQAISDSHVDDDIKQLISQQVDTDGEIELSALEEVQKGYGVCGRYRLADSASATLPFYYSKVNERVSLGADSSGYQRQCSDR